MNPNAYRSPRPAALVIAGGMLALALTACGGGKPDPRPATPQPVATRPATAVPHGDVIQELRRQVEAGRLDQAVLDALTASGTAEGMIVLNEDTIDQQVKQAAAALGVKLDDPQALALRVTAYAALKQQVASLAPGGLKVVEDFQNFGSLQMQFSNGDALLAVLQRPEVLAVTENARRAPSASSDTVPAPDFRVDLSLINQPQAVGAGFTGTGVSVAVLDTGTDYRRSAFGSCTAPAQPANRCRVVAVQDIAQDNGELDSAALHYHGTNVSGIIAGVAPGANIIALHVFDQQNTTSSALELRALDWVMAHRQQYNIVAVNMSLGLSKSYRTVACAATPDASAFQQLRRAGIVPVVSAGNDAMKSGPFHNGVGEPACAPGALSVGAVYQANVGGAAYQECADSATHADLVTCFSQTGPNLGMLAPGALITAAGITMTGTSQAAPHVAAAVAMLASKCQTATADQIVSALTGSGPTVTDPRNGVRKHRLDLAAAGKALTDNGNCRSGSRPAPAAPAHGQPGNASPTPAAAQPRTR